MFFPLEVYAVSGLVNFITSTFLGVFILIKTHRSKTNRLFAYFCFSVSLWSFFYCLWLSTPNKFLAEYYLRTLMIPAFFMPITFIHFIFHFLRITPNPRFIPINYALTIIFMLSVYSPLYANNIGRFLVFPYWLKANIIFHLALTHFISIFIYSLFLLHQSFRRAAGTFRIQILYVYIGMLIACLGGSTNYFSWYRIPIPPFLNVFVSFYVIMVAYSIAKHQLMDILIVIKKGVVYSLLIACISVIYLTFVVSLEKFAQYYLNYHSPWVSLFSVFAIGIMVVPLRNKIRFIIDRILFKGTPQEIVRQNEQLRQEITRSEKYKTLSTLASGIAHEVKNPLTAIKTFTEYLPDKIDDKEFLSRFANIVGREVNRIDEMIHQLLNYGKPALLSIQATNIHKLINDTVDILNSKFIDQKINVNKHFNTDENLTLYIDPNQTRQALLNIFLNAIEAMSKGGKLQVETRRSSKDFEIIVSDTGCGIPADDLAHIFDPFFSRKNQGTGLGLSITQSLIENHKGIIEVRSAVESGTEITIKLPLAHIIPASPGREAD